MRVDVSNVELTDAVISFVRADDGAVYLGNSGTAHAAARRSDKPPPNVMPNGPTGGFPDLFGALQVLDRGIGVAVAGYTDALVAQLLAHNGVPSVDNALDPAEVERQVGEIEKRLGQLVARS